MEMKRAKFENKIKDGQNWENFENIETKMKWTKLKVCTMFLNQ